MDFDFIEMLIDEMDEWLVWLDWFEKKIVELREEMFSFGVCIYLICLSVYWWFLFGFVDLEKKKVVK